MLICNLATTSKGIPKFCRNKAELMLHRYTANFLKFYGRYRASQTHRFQNYVHVVPVRIGIHSNNIFSVVIIGQMKVRIRNESGHSKPAAADVNRPRGHAFASAKAFIGRINGSVVEEQNSRFVSVADQPLNGRFFFILEPYEPDRKSVS